MSNTPLSIESKNKEYFELRLFKITFAKKNMASALKNLSSYDENNIPSAADMTFGIVVADWNAHITHPLYEGCFDTLVKHGANADNIYVLQVPGTFELPAAARMLASKYPSVDAVICIGCVIKGETKHDEYINLSVANALQNLSIATSKSFIFGILTIHVVFFFRVSVASETNTSVLWRTFFFGMITRTLSTFPGLHSTS